ncbi:nucleoside-diphosphate sugar epimerase/dehydratase [Euzebya tangerina]|uniref:nucleoside-diphosphate sugar epimerase/dehydratase n=1 Tax=Euzebya tangerina TaxID=591198 RepID=UPI000E31E37E|nr:nucleoside-diphosphate sugar epimerase/dehydratase [Euzebya tangerina]
MGTALNGQTTRNTASTVARRSVRRALDIGLLLAAIVVAYLVRFDWMIPERSFRQLLLVAPFVVGLQYGLLSAYRVTKSSWRYVTINDLGLLIRALYIAAALIAVARLLGAPQEYDGLLGALTTIPLGVTAINFMTAIIALGGARAVRRSMSEGRQRREVHPGRRAEDTPDRTLLIGAGEGGVAVARQIRMRPDLGIHAVGFIDDDRNKVGQRIHGLPVLGGVADLPGLIEAHQPKNLLITIHDVTGEMVRRLDAIASEYGVSVRKVSGLMDVVAGRMALRPRPIQLEDLLRREAVSTDREGLAAHVTGQTVLVTGAGGSIGSELCRQLLTLQPAKLILVEQAENALYEIHRELYAPAGDTELVAAIGDVTDQSRIESVIARHRPTFVFHAAAHKHVPMMEANPAEAFKNNVLGTRTLVRTCSRLGVDRFVLISTDKAVNPTSIMGATKRVAERVVVAHAAAHGLAYSAVRFGNVLGSNGSVVPLFRQQIEQGGPVTVTHPDMRRYFMTIPEAVELVLQASIMGEGGDIFVLDMGEQIKIVDMARDLIRLSGKRVGEDIEIQFVGLRPGEKMFEELGLGSEQMTPTGHSKVFRWTGEAAEVRPEVLDGAIDTFDLGRVREGLPALVPEFVTDDGPRSEDTGTDGEHTSSGPTVTVSLPREPSGRR